MGIGLLNNVAASLTPFVPLQPAMVILAGTIVWSAGLRTSPSTWHGGATAG